MNNIVVADVFGKTSALVELGSAINADVIVDPYNGRSMNFKDETQAYNYFIEHVGLDKYLATLSKIVKEYSDECTLIGFSVGASVIWQLSQMKSVKIPKVVKHAFCFYGSQIRHFSKLTPTFKVKLIFPKSEPHFDVSTLRYTLAKKQKVTAIQVDFLHGFMNTYSNNFNQIGYKENIALLQQDINDASNDGTA